MFCSSPIRCTGALVVVSAVVFGLVLLNIHVAQTSFQLSDLQKKAATLQDEQRRLRYEVAKAESPEKVVEMSASLGLVPPATQEFLEGPSVLVSDQSEAEARTATGPYAGTEGAAGTASPPNGAIGDQTSQDDAAGTGNTAQSRTGFQAAADDGAGNEASAADASGAQQRTEVIAGAGRDG